MICFEEICIKTLEANIIFMVHYVFEIRVISGVFRVTKQSTNKFALIIHWGEADSVT